MTQNKDKVACRTPNKDGKPTNIPRWKFDAVAAAIRDVVGREGIPFADLPSAVGGRLGDDVRTRLGSLGWHVTTVKLEMEVAGDLMRFTRGGKQWLRLAGDADG